jgi:hypothetical protein
MEAILFRHSDLEADADRRYVYLECEFKCRSLNLVREKLGQLLPTAKSPLIRISTLRTVANWKEDRNRP